MASTSTPSAVQDGSAAHNAEADDFVETVTAAMPPNMQRHKDMTPDEILAEMNRIPLFMRTLDETADGTSGENTLLEAIKALAYEGTKAEVAAQFKSQGNEVIQSKKWFDAREFYTKAILALRGKIELSAPPEENDRAALDMKSKADAIVDLEAEEKRERELQIQCLVNRAKCNFEMENYGSCNRDCADALMLDPKNIKAWFRAASACLALNKIDEAADACDSGLKISPNNAELKALHTKVLAKGRRNAELAAEKAQREHVKATLQKALRDRKLVVRRTTGNDSALEAALQSHAIVELEDPNDHTSPLLITTMIVYPLAEMTDTIQSYHEEITFEQQFSESQEPYPGESRRRTILQPLWDDRKKEYQSVDQVDFFMPTAQGGLIKPGKNLTLRKVLDGGKVEIVDNVLSIFVVPKLRATEFVERFKQERSKRS